MSPRKEAPVILSIHVRASDAENAEEGAEVHNERSTVNADASSGYGNNYAMTQAIPAAVQRAIQSLQNRAAGEPITEASISISVRQF
jgi:hypothetical protein